MGRLPARVAWKTRPEQMLPFFDKLLGHIQRAQEHARSADVRLWKGIRSFKLVPESSSCAKFLHLHAATLHELLQGYEKGVGKRVAAAAREQGLSTAGAIWKTYRAAIAAVGQRASQGLLTEAEAAEQRAECHRALCESVYSFSCVRVPSGWRCSGTVMTDGVTASVYLERDGAPPTRPSKVRRNTARADAGGDDGHELTRRTVIKKIPRR